MDALGCCGVQARVRVCSSESYSTQTAERETCEKKNSSRLTQRHEHVRLVEDLCIVACEGNDLQSEERTQAGVQQMREWE